MLHDLILEILSRLPFRSVCRFKCVSVPWRDLISDPANRKTLPQTLAGFLFTTRNGGGAWMHHFAGLPFPSSPAPVDPSLPFLKQNKYKYIYHVDSVNGLVLSAFFSKETPPVDEDEFGYVVCNPATDRWIELPPQPWANTSDARLAFDPAVSSHFHVVKICENILGVENYVTGVDIFSSRTGAWIHGDSRLVEKFQVFDWRRSVFFGGMLHLFGRLKPSKESALLVVDMEGKTWKTICLPGYSDCGAIEVSQGCLYYATTTRAYVNIKINFLATEIKLWCLENYERKEWVLKHSVSIDEPLSIIPGGCGVFAIHPDCDTVFLVTCARDTLVAYDMQQRKFVHIRNHLKGKFREYLPYVPLF